MEHHPGELRRVHVGALQKAKKSIDNAGINEYNVKGISNYAKINYDTERYDEVEAEYMATTKGK